MSIGDEKLNSDVIRGARPLAACLVQVLPSHYHVTPRTHNSCQNRLPVYVQISTPTFRCVSRPPLAQCLVIQSLHCGSWSTMQNTAKHCH